MGRRFWLEVSCAAAAAGLATLTVLWQSWIEALFGLDPDGGGGATEWSIVAALFAASVLLTVAAVRDRRADPAAETTA